MGYLVRFASIIGAAALFAGCGAQSDGSLPQSVGTQNRAHNASSYSGDLLYLPSDYVSKGALMIMSFPDGQPVAYISVSGNLWGICSDNNGNVFAAMQNNFVPAIYEFSHGGTTPITTLTGSDLGYYGCAVDSTTGDLAVITTNSKDVTYISVWAPYNGQYSGSPNILQPPFVPESIVYDGSGNLFALACGSPSCSLYELPAGETTFKQLRINRPLATGGNLAWDGHYLALETGVGRHFPGRVYQLKVKGSNAKVIKTMHPAGFSNATPNICIIGSTLISRIYRHRAHHTGLGLWHYPQGGKIYGWISAGSPVTVSVAPSRSPVRN